MKNLGEKRHSSGCISLDVIDRERLRQRRSILSSLSQFSSNVVTQLKHQPRATQTKSNNDISKESDGNETNKKASKNRVTFAGDVFL